MNEYHHEISAYLACGNTQLLADAIVRLCEAEGMRRVLPTPIPVDLDTPPHNSNHWSVAVIPGVPGWHLLLSYPESLLCERGFRNGKARMIDLCESVGAVGFVREVYDGFGGSEAFGRVTLESDGKGRHALSGRMWRGDEAQCKHWYGMDLPPESEKNDLQLIQALLPKDWIQDTQALRCDLVEARLCGEYAQQITGPVTSRWWQPESAWYWFMEALRLGGPMPVDGGIILSFQWPAGDRPDPRVQTVDLGEPDWSNFCYGDGNPILVGDIVRDREGNPFTITARTTTSSPAGPVPGGVLARFSGGETLLLACQVGELRLVERLSMALEMPSIMMLQERAEQEHAEAMHLLASYYEKGNGVPRNRLMATALYRRAAELGLASSQLAWGQALCEGDAAPRDWETGTRWIRQAAENGNVDAQLAMAKRYAAGIGVPQDKVQFVYWLEKAAALDDESAQFELAFIYYIGDDEVSRNLPRAIHWLTKAARRGNHKAQYFLGLSHERGEGLAQDYTKAVHWYRIAAEQGSRQAQCNLADKYEHGLGVERDLPLAAHWYRKSAEQQIAPAQYSLGILYLEGRGVATDPDQGKYWLQQAAMQGYEDAIEALNRLD
jgi:TPR repeat protein